VPGPFFKQAPLLQRGLFVCWPLNSFLYDFLLYL